MKTIETKLLHANTAEASIFRKHLLSGKSMKVARNRSDYLAIPEEEEELGHIEAGGEHSTDDEEEGLNRGSVPLALTDLKDAFF